MTNIIVKQLADEGISTVNWTNSPGEWEYIAAPYDSCDILIVAGSDKDATRKAAQELIDRMPEAPKVSFSGIDSSFCVREGNMVNLSAKEKITERILKHIYSIDISSHGKK